MKICKRCAKQRLRTTQECSSGICEDCRTDAMPALTLHQNQSNYLAKVSTSDVRRNALAAKMNAEG